jgi:hypothetical protein
VHPINLGSQHTRGLLWSHTLCLKIASFAKPTTAASSDPPFKTNQLIGFFGFCLEDRRVSQTSEAERGETRFSSIVSEKKPKKKRALSGAETVTARSQQKNKL